jgi:glycosyltransferase involved in cell wall biosynthesis
VSTKRIAILAPESFPRTWGAFAGGITQYAAAMTQGYARLGHDVHVFAGAPEAGTESWGGATVHFTGPTPLPAGRRAQSLTTDELRMYLSYRAEARNGAFDLLEVVDWNTPAMLVMHAAHGGRSVLKLHGPTDFIAKINDVPLRGLSRVIARRERHLARQVSLLCSADPTLARSMAEIWRLPAAPVTIPDPVLPPVTNDATRRERPSGLRIISVGRLEHRKDQLTLVRALNRVAGELGEWDATLVGPDTQTGPGGSSYLAAVQAEASPEVKQRLRYHGVATKDELWGMYREADVAVVCTVDGAYGYSTLDAMVAGLPVVTTTPATAEAKSPYVLDGTTALTYPAQEPHALATALRRVASDRALGPRLSEAARRHVLDELAPEQIARRVIDLACRPGLRAARHRRALDRLAGHLRGGRDHV